MSHARQNRRLARETARRLGAAAGAEAVEDFANTGGHELVDGYEVPGAPATADDLLATIAPHQESWDCGAINAGAAEVDHCPRGFESAYYEAYEQSARATVLRLAEALP